MGVSSARADGLDLNSTRWLALSLLIHVAVFSALMLAPTWRGAATQEFPDSTMELIEVEPAVEEIVAPEPEPENVVEPEPLPTPVARPTAPTPEPTTAAEPPPLEEAIAEFSGETLTNDAPGEGWNSALGNGAAMDGPIGQPNAVVTGRRREGAAGGVPDGQGDREGPPVVAIADLSERPRPPDDLNDRLQRVFPARARQMGESGRVRARLRVMPDGRSARIRTTVDPETSSEFASDFVAACRRFLEELDWSPPKDRSGAAVATEVEFTCNFRIGY